MNLTAFRLRLLLLHKDFIDKLFSLQSSKKIVDFVLYDEILRYEFIKSANKLKRKTKLLDYFFINYDLF